MRSASKSPATVPTTVERLRVTPWRGSSTMAHVVPVGALAPTAAAVERCLRTLRERGYRAVLTGAMAPAEQAVFLAAGFRVHQRLHLLSRHLDGLPNGGTSRLRRGRRSDRAAVLAVDAAAFPAFWRLDEASLDDALTATPSSRFRVAPDAEGATPPGGIAGYAVVGRAGSRGYVQRLAVHPDRQRGGLGSDLLLDGLRWLRRWGASEALVNTQVGNDTALALYERHGFRRRPEGLAVLRYDDPLHQP